MNYYSVPQAAKLLGRTRQDVWYLIKNNRIPSIKVGRFYVVNEEDIKKHLEKRFKPSNSVESNKQYFNK